MVRAVCTSILIALLTGCAHRAASPAAVPFVWSVRDTATYENTLSEGLFGSLYVGSVFVDSVDLAFGVHPVAPDQLVFLPVEAHPSEETPPVGVDITEHVLYSGRKRTVLRSLLPHFDAYFSSPTVIGARLYYWGLEPLTEPGEYRLHAKAYDFESHRIFGRMLGEREVRTDFRFHLPPPWREGHSILYRTDDETFRLSPDLEAIQIEALAGDETRCIFPEWARLAESVFHPGP